MADAGVRRLTWIPAFAGMTRLGCVVSKYIEIQWHILSQALRPTRTGAASYCASVGLEQRT